MRRSTGFWTPAVHDLLAHLERVGFDRAPRALGYDERGREVLSFLPGDTATDQPWPEWTRSEAAMLDAVDWLREYHSVVAGYVPPASARWRFGEVWRPGLIVAHNDAGPHNAAWGDGRIRGFFDWDFAGPAEPVWDLAYLAFAWVPLYDSELDAERPRRLRMLLDRYGYHGDVVEFRDLVARRVRYTAAAVERLGRAGDPGMAVQYRQGNSRLLEQSAAAIARLSL
ncbi:phosphotransferase [Lysobacter korlensis]|uniref:Phosphotransferase n=1 Tax=Lysobacter korlensis TaxID=553636 RepID=A0ABV6RNP8_9GAMM